MNVFRIGLGSYAFTWACGVRGYPLPAHPWSATHLLEKAAELGVEVVQIADNIPLAELNEKKLRILRAFSETKNVAIEVGTKGTNPELLVRYVDIAAFFNSPILRTLIVEENPKASEKEYLEKAESQIREVLPALEEKGIILAVENYERYTSGSLKRLVDNLQSSYVGVCLDTVNSFGVPEDQQRTIETLAPATVNLHVKDFRIARLPHTMGFLLEGTPTGEGMLDIDALIKTLPAKEMPISAIIELWTPYQGDIQETVRIESEWAERSVTNLRRILKDG
jgi:sugar phosphate isomerase/epimerase